MISENFKNKFFGTDFILRLLMAGVFISAGVFRIFNPVAAEMELIKLGVPAFFTWVLIIFEIFGGLVILIGGKLLKYVAWLFLLFLAIALGLAIRINSSGIINQAGELFVFDAGPTDFFLHFVFFIIILSLLRSFYRKK